MRARDSRRRPLDCCSAAKTACSSLTCLYTVLMLHCSKFFPQPRPETPMLTAEQLIAAQKANLETVFGLTNKAFEGLEKLVELNVQAAKSALSEAAQTSAAALSAKDPQEWLALQARQLQPAAEKAAAFSRHLYDIAAGTN